MRSLRILVGADVLPDRNSGAAGVIFYTNSAYRELGHEVDEIWADDLPRKIRHGNLHYWLELPSSYRRAVAARCAHKTYDVIQLSQPWASLAARSHQQKGSGGIMVNRSQGLELLVDRLIPCWRVRLGVPENRFPRSWLSALLRPVLQRHSYLAYRYSDGIIVVSRMDATFLTGELGVPATKVAVVTNGVTGPFLDFPLAPMTAGRLTRILFVGQFAFYKGPHILAKLLCQLLAQRENWSMTWVCHPSDHQAVMNLIQPAIRPRVRFLGWMKQDELLKVYDSHGLFIAPSIYEGSCKVCLEAMARGLCVVASDTAAMSDYIENGVSGFLVPVGDVEKFVAASLRVLGDLPLAERISEQARVASAGYACRRCAEQEIEFYHQLLDQKRRRHLQANKAAFNSCAACKGN